MKKVLILMWLLWFIPHFIHAQDSIKTLNAEQVLLLIKQFHPVARQAAIQVEQARAEVRLARAAFDPVLSYAAAAKTLDGTSYYDYNSTQVMMPTWYGIEVYGGADYLTGNRIDQSETDGQTGYLGISIPLARDLVLDKRRAYLKQAKLFRELSLADQRAIINNLLFDAMDAYWQWVRAYQNFVVIRDNVNITVQRNDLIRKSFMNGERPAIDTVEALTLLQSFQYQQNQSWLEFQNASLLLSVYLWKNGNMPYTLPDGVVPQAGWENETVISKFNLVLDDLLSIAQKNHPELQQYEYKIDILQVEKQLKFQQLLPKIDFRYNQLGKGTEWYNIATTGPLFGNNYQYGLKMEIPLRLSEGRAGYKQARLKFESAQLERFQKIQLVNIKVKSYYNEMITLRSQIELQSSNYTNYRQLVRAEETRFANGESSLFLINSREAKALEALQKLIELKTKYYKTIYALQWSAGVLTN